MRSESLEILKTLQEMDAADTLTGCFTDIPIEVYHHPECPGYSSTVIKRLVEKSYNHWYCDPIRNVRPLEFGSAFHCFVNEPELFLELFTVVQTDSRMTGTWKSAVKTRGEGKTLLTLTDFECLRVMSTKLFEHPDVGPYLAGARFENTFFSRDQVTGLLKKCRPDIKTPAILWDLKSTMDASADAFTWDMRSRLQRISSAYYLEIVSEVERQRYEEFRLVACEKVEPWEISVKKVAPMSIARAQGEIRTALGTIRRILDEGPGAWKGYQLGVEEIAI